jgi:hypothetical protein
VRSQGIELDVETVEELVARPVEGGVVDGIEEARRPAAQVAPAQAAEDRRGRS